MELAGIVALVTGGASGLGRATVECLVREGAKAVIVDLPTSAGAQVAERLGNSVRFAPADVTDEAQLQRAFDVAGELGPLRVLIHCAGRGGTLRTVDKAGNPGALDFFEQLVRVNLTGSFNALRLAAARMAKNEPLEGDRGVCVLTASIAAYEGQVGQVGYAASKAGVVGLTLAAARDLASRGIRVCTIAPGVFDTPILDRHPPEIKAGLVAGIPHPRRMGRAQEYAMLATHIVRNPMLNGETIRLDGALRMSPR